MKWLGITIIVLAFLGFQVWVILEAVANTSFWFQLILAFEIISSVYVMFSGIDAVSDWLKERSLMQQMDKQARWNLKDSLDSLGKAQKAQNLMSDGLQKGKNLFGGGNNGPPGLSVDVLPGLFGELDNDD